LTILEKEGLVTQRYRGKQRLIRLNLENEKTQLLLQIIRLLKITHKEYAQKKTLFSEQLESKKEALSQLKLNFNSISSYTIFNKRGYNHGIRR
jgi:hypothetical protein